MEKLFENQYTHSKEFHKELYSYGFLKTPISNRIGIGSIVCIVLAIVWIARSLASPEPFRISEIPYLVKISLLQVVLWPALCVAFSKTAELAYRQELEQNGNRALKANYRLTESGIDTIFEGGESEKYTTLTYDKIKKVKRTTNYCLLVSKAGLICALKNDSFTYGNFEDFLSFLRSKGFKC